MKRGIGVELMLLMAFLVGMTALIAVSGADQRLSSLFYINGGWPVGDQPFWQLLYRIDRNPAVVLGCFGLLGFLLSFWRQDYLKWRRAGAFLVVLLVLGPGLLVNSVFKEHWGRPRPREVSLYGGSKQFLHPWQKGENGKGRSFPSGHSSAAFYLAAPYLVYRRSNRRVALIWLTSGLSFGLVMSIARISQGAHFLSDTLWAFGMVAICALLLSSLFRLDCASDPTPGHRG